MNIGDLYALYSKTTPGMWENTNYGGQGHCIYAKVDLKIVPKVPVMIWQFPLIAEERWIQFAPEGWNEMQAANSAFITAAHNALPDIIKEIEEWREHDWAGKLIIDLQEQEIARLKTEIEELSKREKPMRAFLEICPTCDQYIEEVYGEIINFCPKCGQAIERKARKGEQSNQG